MARRKVSDQGLGSELIENIDEKKANRNNITTYLNQFQLTQKQKELQRVLDRNKIIIISGQAGTSKSFSVAFYITELLSKNPEKYSQFILTKPVEESGEKLGFLPGNKLEKIEPHYESFSQNFLQLMSKTDYTKLTTKEKIKFEPLAYMRGKSFNRVIAWLDEAQNSTWKQIMLFTTRMGKDSKIIISGDVSQYDIRKDMSSMKEFFDMISDIPDVAHFKFERTDIMRDPILIEITDRYEKLKYSNKIKEER